MNLFYPKNVLKIPNATPDTKDAAQYMFRNGRKQWNLCGEFCVAYCTKDNAHTSNIDDFLDYWQAKDLTLYQSLFKNGLSRTTGLSDLEKMLADYGYTIPLPRLSTLPFPITPTDMEATLGTFDIILGVQIDNYGYLVGKGIPHWAVLSGVMPVDNLHALCDIYNPFTNSIEPYSWRELMTSTGSYKQGLLVRR